MDTGHLSESALEALSLPVDLRSAWACRDRFIVHEQIHKIFSITNMIAYGEGRRRARGIIVSGTAGSGKTMIADALIRLYPEAINERTGRLERPVIRITMTNASDASAISWRTLHALGCPHVADYTKAEREQLAVDLLKRASVRLLIIDEIQDILKRSDRSQQNTFEGVKYLMNETGIGVAALGTEDAETAMTRDEHLASRFRKVQLPLWRTGPLLANFLDELETGLPLPERSRLASHGVMRFLVKSAGGQLDAIVERVSFAAALAIEGGEHRISMALLERAEDEIPRFFEQRAKGGGA